MKAALLRGPGDIIIDEIPIPEISDEEVLVEVKYCGICGSDLDGYRTAIHYSPGTYIGHEYSGVVAKVGRNVKGFKVGDRVTVWPPSSCGECYYCRRGHELLCVRGLEQAIGVGVGLKHAGGFAKFVRGPQPQKRLYLLPDELSFEEGAMVEPLACGLHAVRQSNFRPRDDTMVLGAGPLGWAVIAFLKNAGAGLIIATEILERRAKMAKKFGADYVFNPHKEPNLKEKVFELTNGKGVDVVYTCAGVADVFRTARDFIRRGGQIMVVDCCEKGVEIIPTQICYNEWNIKGSLDFDVDDGPMTIEFLKKGLLPVPVKEWTRKVKLSNIKEAFEVLTSQIHNELKILVEPED